DGSASAQLPYSVEARRYLTAQLQPSVAGQASVFFSRHLESLHYNYERNPADPRVTHDFTIHVDGFGNVGRSCSLAYPRRGGDSGIPAQSALSALQRRTAYLNVTDPFRLLGAISEEIDEQLLGLVVPAGGYIGYDELAAQLAAGTPASRVGWRRYRYQPDAGRAALAPQLLLHSVEEAEFDRAQLVATFAPVLDTTDLDAMLASVAPDGGGYVGYDDGDAAGFWWNPGNTLGFTLAAGFYRPATSTDPFGNVTTCSDDPYALFVVSLEDALGNRTIIEAIDYQALQPARIRDPNDALFEAGFDPLGLVAVTTAHGSEGGQAAGFAPLSDYRPPSGPVSLAAILAAPAAYLQGAATLFAYDMLAWTGTVPPAAFAALDVDAGALWADLDARGYITREGALCERFRTAARDGDFQLAPRFAAVRDQVAAILGAVPSGAPVAALRLSAADYPPLGVAPIAADILYCDGIGRGLQTKTRSDEPQPTLAPDGASTLGLADATDNWLTSGALRYNAKGDAVRRFEPFFTAHPAFDPLEAAVRGVSATLYYDALDRLVQVETPQQTLRKIRYGAIASDGTGSASAWAIAAYDENDALMESAYYRVIVGDPHADPYEKAAVSLAALGDGSPVRTLLDPLGRAVRNVRQNDGVVTAVGLQTLGYDVGAAQALLAGLARGGYLDFRGALTTGFQPGQVGWTLILPAPFAADEAKISAYLSGVQQRGTPVTIDFALDIRGNALRIVDDRLGAAGAANARIDYSLTDIAVHELSADAGPRWQLHNAAGNTIFERDGNGNALATAYDALQRIASRHLAPSAGASVRIFRLLYGDSARRASATAAWQPYFPAPETWNLRGRPVAMLDSAGLVLTPFWFFHEQPMTYRRWVRADAVALPDWAAISDGDEQALATALAALAGPDGLPGLALPGAIQAPLETAGYGGRAVYDALGRMTSATDPDGNVTTCAINLRGLVDAIGFTPAAAGAAPTAILPIAYDAHARPRQIIVPGTARTVLSYHPQTFRLIGIETSSLAEPAPADPLRQSLAYYHDPVGNVMFALDAAALPSGAAAGTQPTQAFAYDLLYRLVRAAGREATSGQVPTPYAECFTYDAGGNAITVGHDGAAGNWSRSFAIAPDSNRLETCSGPGVATGPCTYDLNGNQTSLDGLATIAWSYLNQIAGVTTAPADDGSFRHEYHVYDGAGGRVRKLTQSFAASATRPHETEEVTYLGGLEITRIRSGDAQAPVIAEWHAAGIDAGGLEPARWVSWILGKPDGAACAEMLFPLTDIVGSVRAELNAAGEAVTRREYLPYGAGAMTWARTPEDEALQRRLYSGKERDSASQLYCYGARHYAPWLMRWMSPDPSGAVDTLNLYQFVRSNPATFADSDGRITIHHWNVE
ncbi:MAG TPA: RHS repeat-associated core domain-containing protein, partial [Telluria sp.]|nr:RHS repeat-associated core domain-containing protein [Telluria sp.]